MKSSSIWKTTRNFIKINSHLNGKLGADCCCGERNFYDAQRANNFHWNSRSHLNKVKVKFTRPTPERQLRFPTFLFFAVVKNSFLEFHFRFTTANFWLTSNLIKNRKRQTGKVKVFVAFEKWVELKLESQFLNTFSAYVSSYFFNFTLMWNFIFSASFHLLNNKLLK